jgi:DNA-binding transcriptional ArsR family regulator
MPIDRSAHPDYDLADRVVASSVQQIRAVAHPLRSSLLDLVLERAATVAELAAAVGRPKSTVAHHVGVLVDAGLLRVVRTRRVRAIDERFYGRTARTIAIDPAAGAGAGVVGASGPRANLLAEAAAEAGAAAAADDLGSTLRHARIPQDQAAEFWQRVLALADDFTRLPRAGDAVYGFVAGLYPTDQPVLPDPDPADPG